MIVIFYVLIALFAALIVLKAYQKKNGSALMIGKVMLAVFLLILFYSLSLAAEVYSLKSFFSSLSFVMSDIMVIFFFEYILDFIDLNNKYLRALRMGFYAYAAIDSAFLLINPYKEIAVAYEMRSFYDITVLENYPKLPFIAHFFFSLCIVLLCIILLMVRCFNTPKVYRRRYYMLITGTIAAIFVNCIHFLMVETLPIDLSPILYCIIGMMMYYNTFRYLPMVTMGLTKTMILDHLNEPVILFDYEGRLADLSKSVPALFPEVDFSISDLMLDDFISENRFKGMRNKDINQEFEWSITRMGEITTYLCKYRRLTDEKGRLLGTMMVFSDITFAREAYFSLERSVLYDPVSGFYNKESFVNQIPQWNDKRYWPVALCVCNLNGLRQINNEKGSAYGDALMRETAHIIRTNIGEDTFAAKIDKGDFVIVFEETSHDEAARIMEDIKQKVESELEENSIGVYLEFGIAVKERDDVTVDRILSDARSSMQNKKMLRTDSASSSLVDSLKQTLGESDFETEEHVERTQKMAARLGKRLKLSDSDIGRLELLAVLHDIGKVAIPHDVLVKKGKLNDEEFKIMQQHTVKGYRIAMASPELREIADGILSHHEKWDGTGYPNGLKGEEIPLLARVISAVDSHDVMVHNRPYHQAMPEKNAIRELRRCAGTQFDPHIIEVFTQMLEEEELSDEENNKD
ncbi:MAG TPA: hypothetical protein DCG85_06780 [Lachnospiraceae bacterium]|nr:hypothetical protein [Lachnospiraceae bacterium]